MTINTMRGETIEFLPIIHTEVPIPLIWQYWIYRFFCINVMQCLDLSSILKTGLAKSRHVQLGILSFNDFSNEFQENWQYITIYIAKAT